MVARAVAAHCSVAVDEIVARTRSELDISDRKAVTELFKQERFDAVINCAAYTDVDSCESEQDICYAANASGPENLALECKNFGRKLVTISSDYVFDGEKSGAYTEHDIPNPLGVYAKAKHEGETRSLEANPTCIVVRTGWIYGSGGTNFLSVLPELLREGKTVRAITDSFGTPTFSEDLAMRLRQFAESDQCGIFNVTNEGSGTSYAGYAEKVCDLAGIDRSLLEYTTADELKRPAPRPRNARLKCVRAAEAGFEPLPHWEDALERFVKGKGKGR